MHANKQLVNSENWFLYWSVTKLVSYLQSNGFLKATNKINCQRGNQFPSNLDCVAHHINYVMFHQKVSIYFILNFKFNKIIFVEYFAYNKCKKKIK